MSDHPSRRDVLRTTGTVALGGAASALAAGEPAAPRVDPEPTDGRDDVLDVERQGGTEVFPQSVASGGPTPNGVLLWTRVDPDAYDDGTRLGVEVAADEGFEDTVYRGTVGAERFGPDSDHAVTVDIDGELDPDARYFYRFVYDGDATRVGRCRTLPGEDADPDSLGLAVASCNDYRHGYFGAYAHVADEDVDYLLHLGDLIYEGAGDGPGDRAIELPSGRERASALEDFRSLYRAYRSDEHLQAALRRHTLVHIWDDHEIVNDRWWNYETEAPESASHPEGDDPEFMRRLYVEAIRAYTEHVPVRAEYDTDGDDELAPDAIHENFRLYRSLRFGSLAELFVTDERLYRSPPPGSDDAASSVSAERAADDPGRTMLGRDQRRWFLDGMGESSARWKLWANEVLAAAFRFVSDGTVKVNADAWDGYGNERSRLLSRLREAGVENVVALTGDMHSYLVAYLLDDYDIAGGFEPFGDGEGSRVGVEFMAPAISSDNLVAMGDLPDNETVVAALTAENQHVEWFDSRHWGYAVVELDREELVYSAYAVDRSVDSADAPRKLLRRYRVPAGERKLERVDGE